MVDWDVLSPLPKPDLRAIRDRMVEDLHRLLIPLGALSVAASWLRFGLLGLPNGHAWLMLGLFALVTFAHVLRSRISASARAAVLLSALLAAGVSALHALGPGAPGAFVIPTAVVLSWMLFDRPAPWILASGAALLFVGTALHEALPGPEGGLARRLAPWLQLGLAQLYLGGILVACGQALFQALAEREYRLREERDHLAHLLNGIQEAVFLLAPEDGTVQEANEQAEILFGLPRSALLGRRLEELASDRDGGETAHLVAEGLRAAEKGPIRFLWPGQRVGGETFWSEVAVQAFESGPSRRLLASVRDVDDIVRDQLELARLVAELETRVETRTRDLERSRQDLQAFSYAVSHDLRVPLRAVDGFARIVREEHGDALPEDARRLLDRVVAGAGRMGHLIEALLDLARLDRRPGRECDVDMAAMVAELRDELCASPSSCPGGGCASGCRIRWEITDLPSYRTDPDLVRQIWANLLSNARKFSLEGGGAARVEIGWSRRDDGIWYSVRDNGVGFDMAQAGRLFGVFQRLHGTSVEGLGIGLATVRRILDRTGGAVEAEGRPGLGAEFRFRPGAPAPAREGGAG